jgi:hypothetical protein
MLLVMVMKRTLRLNGTSVPGSYQSTRCASLSLANANEPDWKSKVRVA